MIRISTPIMASLCLFAVVWARDPVTLVAIQDFPNINVNGFVTAYKDNNRKALAVNAKFHKDKYGAANTTFDGASGTYDITIVTLTETDGESTYRLVIGGTQIGSFQNPSSNQDYKEIEHTWEAVTVNSGDEIQVEFNTHTNGKIPEGSGTAYSRGRWRRLVLTPVSVSSSQSFIRKQQLTIPGQNSQMFSATGRSMTSSPARSTSGSIIGKRGVTINLK